LRRQGCWLTSNGAGYGRDYKTAGHQSTHAYAEVLAQMRDLTPRSCLMRFIPYNLKCPLNLSAALAFH
jgi:hypothetical protein